MLCLCLFVFVCACVRECVQRACVRAYVYEFVHVHICVHMRIFLFIDLQAANSLDIWSIVYLGVAKLKYDCMHSDSRTETDWVLDIVEEFISG